MLGDRRDALQWEETTMDDGKPLLVSIADGHGALALEFVKTGEGLWAEGKGAVCRNGTDFEIRFEREQFRFGPAANWLLRNLSGRGGRFTMTLLGSARMRIATRGWSGVFAPKVSCSMQAQPIDAPDCLHRVQRNLLDRNQRDERT